MHRTSVKDASPQERRRGRHVVRPLHTRLVFAAKHRGRALDARAHERLGEVFGTVCADFEPELDELDHVHLLVWYRPKVALARLTGLVGSLEGVSSRRLRAERAEIGAPGPILWSASYFAGSVGGAPLEVPRRYIEGQDAPH